MVGVVDGVVCFDSRGRAFVAEHISPILISFHVQIVCYFNALDKWLLVVFFYYLMLGTSAIYLSHIFYCCILYFLFGTHTHIIYI